MSSVRRATVFGGSGFIGRYVVQRLAQEGAVVAVVSRHAGRSRTLLTMGDVGQVALINADISDEKVIGQALEGADTVINLTGILTEVGTQRFDRLLNAGAETVARLSMAAGVRKLVHVSAIGASASSPSRYARAKWEGEQAVRREFPAATIFRPSVVFGPEDDFFNRFARMARTSPFMPLIGGGKTRFQPVYVGDVADAIIAAVESDRPLPQTFELGGPRIYTFRELMELLLAEIDPDDSDSVLKSHALITVPQPVARVIAFLTDVFWSAPFAPELLGQPPLTRDQLLLLGQDNVVDPGLDGFAALGIVPTSPELILPRYLSRFRKDGWYSMRRLGS